MNRYTKIIGITGSIYTKEFVKIKNHKNKIREISESTVIKSFKEGDAEIDVYFEEDDRIITVSPFSSDEDIKKFLGKKFLK